MTPAHEFELELAQAGTTGMDEDTEIGILDDARHGAAALFGASPDTIAIATSFTEALNQVAWWLRPGRGQNIVSSEVDFPSVTYPWHRIAADTGCQVRLVGVLDDPDSFDVNKIAGSVDSATAAICISHIQYLTGHLLDLGELAALAHDNGAVLIVDATQSAGQVPIDVTASAWTSSSPGPTSGSAAPLALRSAPQPHPAQRIPAAAGGLAQHRAPLLPRRPVASPGRHRTADGVLHHVLRRSDRARPRYRLHLRPVPG